MRHQKCPKSPNKKSKITNDSVLQMTKITKTFKNSRFELHVNITVCVGISFSKQNCSPRQVTVSNLSTAMCSSTKSLGAGGYFRRLTRRTHLDRFRRSCVDKSLVESVVKHCRATLDGRDPTSSFALRLHATLVTFNNEKKTYLIEVELNVT